MIPICERRHSAGIFSFKQVKPSGACAIPDAKGMKQCHTPLTPCAPHGTDLRKRISGEGKNTKGQSLNFSPADEQ